MAVIVIGDQLQKNMNSTVWIHSFPKTFLAETGGLQLPLNVGKYLQLCE